MSFIAIWVMWAICGVAALSAALVWAVRTRQFTELDRQRHIPLKAARIREGETPVHAPSRADRFALLAILIVTLCVLTSAIWLGIRSI